MASIQFQLTDNATAPVVWTLADQLQGNAGVASSVTVSPNPLVFTPSPPTTPVTQTIVITNNNPGSITLNPPVFPPAASFNLTPAFSAGATGTCNTVSTTTINGGGGSCTLSITFTDPTTSYGPLATQPAIGPQKNTLMLSFHDDGSFVTETLRGNPAPMSGQLLQLVGTVSSGANAMPVNLAIYDSQIHTGLSPVQPIPVSGSCTAFDATFPTDAYILQAGSWTGCDAGEAFEAGLGQGSAKLTSPANALVPYEFDITTNYVCAPLDPVTHECNATPVNVHGINVNDSSYITVTNAALSTFSGTITLSGLSTECGQLSDSVSPANFADGSISLTLVPQNGAAADNSFCGGFEAPQTMSITAGATTTFPYGQNDYKITPFNSFTCGVNGFPACTNGQHSDQVTFMVVPFPDNVGEEAGVAVFQPGDFPGYRCTPYGDLSFPEAPANPPLPPNPNPVCAGLQIRCIPGNPSDASQTGDCESYIYTSQLDYTLAADQFQNATGTLGAPGFLGVHHENFPPPSTDPFNLNTLVSYNGDCCVKTTGGRDGSAHIDVWNPSFPPLTTLNIFTGFGLPIHDIGPDPSNPVVNLIKAGRAVPLPFTQDDTTGAPVTTLSLCPSLAPDGSSCSDGTVQAPWLVVLAFGVTCPNTSTGVVDNTTFPAGNSSLQNFSSTTPGSYQYNWKTPGGATGCARLVFIYNTGTAFLTPAEFQFK
jgi:hypothetical protein